MIDGPAGPPPPTFFSDAYLLFIFVFETTKPSIIV